MTLTPRPALLFFALASVLALGPACASSQPHAASVTHLPSKSLPMCAGSMPVHCLTTPNCQYDEAHQCQACVCSDAWQPPERLQTAPFGNP